MKSIRNPDYIATVLAMVAFGVTTAAHAQLGSTGRAGDASQGAVTHRAQGGLVAYHETTDANGIVVRQYLDSSGTVYAVSWRGPAMPDVRSLLGTCFETFREGANAAIGEAGLHTARVAKGDLVVENRVRLREFSGRAWLASALPPGVSATDIQ
ncbi:DUF2844 domain-containing protein [Caballeronia ptereochthonis]|uniref:Lipoprotein n=1 Tax=Caballeronia ptereochthonis TaxID=1777144 RepID=A0A158A717_9BURK|nr:DUF2844 domain-containing protein [Caballeronia ptereochthonis]SAK53651.1 hypothetical protein AWB83_01420 [Caballeronia ptereochthonis]